MLSTDAVSAVVGEGSGVICVVTTATTAIVDLVFNIFTYNDYCYFVSEVFLSVVLCGL